MSPLVYNPQPRDGPVAITFEFEVEQPRSSEFLRLMRELRFIHLRNGAFGWRLDEELTRCNTYRVELTVPSWTGYLLQRQRLTKAEQEIIKKVWGLHVGEQIPLERVLSLCKQGITGAGQGRGRTINHVSESAGSRYSIQRVP